MRCLVTGASGQLGAHIIRCLLTAGVEVVALVRPTSDLWRLQSVYDHITLVYGDLSDLSGLAKALEQRPADVTIHLAWFGILGAERNDPKQVTVNVQGSLDLFEIVRHAGCSCWLACGSQEEVGPYTGILTEDVTPRPISMYGVAKLSVAMLTRELCRLRQMRYVWMRLLATYGPQDDPRHFIPYVIERLLAHESPALTAGEQYWDYLYVEDAAEAFCRAALHPTAAGTFNLGSGAAVSIRSIAETLGNLIDPEIALGFGQILYGPYQVMHLQADISRLQAAIDWRPQIGLEVGLQRTVAWHRTRRGDRSSSDRTSVGATASSADGSAT